MGNNSNSLYNRLIKITYEYFGPAANRFVRRQILNHINKRPEDLAIGDMERLIDWMGIAMALLTEDEQLIKAYRTELSKLLSPAKH